MIDNYVRLPTFPNCLEGRRLFVHFSISLMAISNLQKGSITVSLTLTSFSRSRYEIKVPGRDDAALVQPSGQVDHDLARAMIVDDLVDRRVAINYQLFETHLKLANVAVLHHDSEKTDDHFGTWPENMMIIKKKGIFCNFESHLSITCLLPLFSALLMQRRASARLFIRTILIFFLLPLK